MNDAALAGTLLELLKARNPSASVCPSEVSRALLRGDQWRQLMPQIRAMLPALMRAGWIAVTRGNERLGQDELDGGPIRIRRGEHFDRWVSGSP